MLKDDTWFHVDVDGRDVLIITSFLFLNIWQCGETFGVVIRQLDNSRNSTDSRRADVASTVFLLQNCSS